MSIERELRLLKAKVASLEERVAAKKITRATVKSALRKMGLSPDEYDMSGKTVTFWPTDRDPETGDRIRGGRSLDDAEDLAVKLDKMLGGGNRLTSNGYKWMLDWSGNRKDMGDWNDPSSRWHY